MRSKRPSPRGPVRRSGVTRRPSPLATAGQWRATFVQITPAVNGLARDPRTSTIWPSSTATSRLQVSGQSKGQTLACTVRMVILRYAKSFWTARAGSHQASVIVSRPDAGAVRIVRGAQVRVRFHASASDFDFIVARLDEAVVDAAGIADVAHDHRAPERVAERRGGHPADKRAVPPDRLVSPRPGVLLSQREGHESLRDASRSLSQHGLASPECGRLVELDGELEARL